MFKIHCLLIAITLLFINRVSAQDYVYLADMLLEESIEPTSFENFIKIEYKLKTIDTSLYNKIKDNEINGSEIISVTFLENRVRLRGKIIDKDSDEAYDYEVSCTCANPNDDVITFNITTDAITNSSGIPRLNRSSWASITGELFLNNDDGQAEIPIRGSLFNERNQNVESSTLSLISLSINMDSRKFIGKVTASSKFLHFDERSKIHGINQSMILGTWSKTEQLTVNRADNFDYRLEFDFNPNIRIDNYIQDNGMIADATIIGIISDVEIFKQINPRNVHLTNDMNFLLTHIEDQSGTSYKDGDEIIVHGTNNIILELTTSGISNRDMLQLEWIDDPYNDPQRKNYENVDKVANNRFNINLNTKSKKFKYGSFRFKITGQSTLGLLKENTFRLTKNIIPKEFTRVEFNPQNNSYDVSIKFKENVTDTLIMYFEDPSKKTIHAKKIPPNGNNIYKYEIMLDMHKSLSNMARNYFERVDQKYIKLKTEAFGNVYDDLYIPVSEINLDEISKIAERESGRNRRKEAIRKYLEKNNFQGDFETTIDKLVRYIEDDGNVGSGFWASAAGLLKPMGGVIMLLLGGVPGEIAVNP